MYKENYVIDKKGRKIAVQLPMKVYKKLIADSEELEEIHEYREARLHKGDLVPFDQAFKEIETSEE